MVYVSIWWFRSTAKTNINTKSCACSIEINGYNKRDSFSNSINECVHSSVTLMQHRKDKGYKILNFRFFSPGFFFFFVIFAISFELKLGLIKDRMSLFSQLFIFEKILNMKNSWKNSRMNTCIHLNSTFVNILSKLFFSFCLSFIYIYVYVLSIYTHAYIFSESFKVSCRHHDICVFSE